MDTSTHFKRFHERLKEKAEQPAAKAVTYVAIGDSVTQGCMELDIIEQQQVYHQLFKQKVVELYPSTIVNVINSGVGGETITQSKPRWERDLLQYGPDLVTISFGLNDAHGGLEGLATFLQSTRELAEQIRLHTAADILLITPGMMMKHDNTNIHSAHRDYIPGFIKIYEAGNLVLYKDALLELAAELEIPCLDQYKLWLQLEEAGVDIHMRLCNGINHPDRAFHHTIAQAISEVVLV